MAREDRTHRRRPRRRLTLAAAGSAEVHARPRSDPRRRRHPRRQQLPARPRLARGPAPVRRSSSRSGGSTAPSASAATRSSPTSPARRPSASIGDAARDHESEIFGGDARRRRRDRGRDRVHRRRSRSAATTVVVASSGNAEDIERFIDLLGIARRDRRLDDLRRRRREQARARPDPRRPREGRRRAGGDGRRHQLGRRGRREGRHRDDLPCSAAASRRRSFARPARRRSTSRSTSCGGSLGELATSVAGSGRRSARTLPPVCSFGQ